MSNLELKISTVENVIAVLKQEFEAYIANKSVPLETRWALFIKTPDYLKNTKYSMCSEWGTYFCADYVGYDEQYHVERYSFVNASEVIACAEDDKECYEGTWDFFDIDEAKEKILAANLHGAKYGW